MEINMTYQDATRIASALQQLVDDNRPVNIDVTLQLRRWRNDLKLILEEREEIIAAAQEKYAERNDAGQLAYDQNGLVRYRDVLALNRELGQAVNRETPVALRGFAPALVNLLGRPALDNEPVIRGGAEFTAMFGETVKASLVLELGPLLVEV